MRELSEQYGLRVANVFHAGDGNLHPLILYDANQPGEIERAEAFGADILRLCVEVGGVLTGEHGVGVEKRDLMGTMFNETDLEQQQRLKCAFDPRRCSTPARCSRSSAAAPNWAVCTSIAAGCPFPTCRVSDPGRERCGRSGSPLRIKLREAVAEALPRSRWRLSAAARSVGSAAPCRRAQARSVAARGDPGLRAE